MGLPDKGQPNSNPADPRDNPAKRDRHYGLLLSKNGPTPDCSAAGARLNGTPKTFVLNELGFDYRNGSHCGAGSPRFNAITPEGLIYFIGCIHGSPGRRRRRNPPSGPGSASTTQSVHPQVVTNPPFQFGVTRVARLVDHRRRGHGHECRCRAGRADRARQPGAERTRRDRALTAAAVTRSIAATCSRCGCCPGSRRRPGTRSTAGRRTCR